jgi:hypothetical protein
MEMTAQILILATWLASVGQTPTTPQPSSSHPDDRLAAVPAPTPVTVEGCVATTREVHGGSTNLAERIGLDDGFLLTSARVVKGRVPAAAADVSSAKAPLMFAITGLSDEQLKPHLGRRVRIEGSVVAGDVPEAGKAEPVAALTVTTIRQIFGTCAVRKASEE